jgi:hypothetical protein
LEFVNETDFASRERQKVVQFLVKPHLALTFQRHPATSKTGVALFAEDDLPRHFQTKCSQARDEHYTPSTGEKNISANFMNANLTKTLLSDGWPEYH